VSYIVFSGVQVTWLQNEMKGQVDQGKLTARDVARLVAQVTPAWPKLTVARTCAQPLNQ
jgi:hypothetical protein